ncbi:hypothetical protein KUCAC02_025129 [Chaenocephalus aceratus]|nr:hypothetical protein KUCAC02_033101 [Chaenocephalus aceratus]KAI4797400.1 hypothetical protein KUCAC02_025129 [Chaenocephalus aceratus]
MANTRLSVLYAILAVALIIPHSASSQHAPFPESPGRAPARIPDPGTSGSLREEDNFHSPLESTDHRVILRPGKWKIRAPEPSPQYVSYQFLLAFEPRDLRFEYPECSRVACAGLPDSHPSCGHLCRDGTLGEARVALDTALLDYNTALSLLHVTFADLAVLMGRHIIARDWDASHSVSELLAYNGEPSDSSLRVVDVMQDHRILIEMAKKKLSSARADEDRSDPGPLDGSAFSESLETWKAGAFNAAVHLNAITFVLHGARQRLLSCAQGVRGSDTTGCEPEFVEGYYTDTPVASRSLSSSSIVMVVKREYWNPVVLSHWYMPFLDSSKGNRTCWLDRPMLSDLGANYRVPECDYRGICEPLEVDRDTLAGCDVNENGEVGCGCPVVCGSPCFGAICYRPETDTYAIKTLPRAASGTEARNGLSPFLVAGSPRVLSQAYSLSEADMRTSLAGVRDQSVRSSELLQRGETVLLDVIEMHAKARSYMDRVYTETPERSQGAKWVECERMIGSSRSMAAASVALSALTCPLLIIIIIQIRCSAKGRAVAKRNPL